MKGWLSPVRVALDARTSPVRVFCRDDDAGWDDARLTPLLDRCADAGAPIDLAVIPAELDDARAEWLLARRDAYPCRLGLHQHGWAHVNHEGAGRKCEFGAARSLAALRADVERGRDAMVRAFGRACDPIFTPPWNRCVPGLGPILTALGITVLSRDVTAPPLVTPGLRECPVHVDWSRRRPGASPDPGAVAETCAAALRTGPVVGLLFHHAAMEIADVRRVGELLDELSRHDCVRMVPLMAASLPPAGASAPRGAEVNA